ncbi:MAG: tetratricopeptide repeat protein [Nitrospirota bacterium]
MSYKKGDIIGDKYEVFDILGEGGFGIVYLVYSHELKSVYALKTFRDEYLEDLKTRERFRKEAQVWIDLERHPYLVRAYFVDEISGRLFIAMEHIAANESGLNTLDGYLRHRPPDLAQTLRWAIQFCHGMGYAYSRGIKAHRDIKPANIMIGQDKAVKISDFGLAGILSTTKSSSDVKLSTPRNFSGETYQTMEGTAFGTPPYMPPEQFENAAGCDQRSDIYSFGMALYQMASGGKLPFFPDMSGGRDNDIFRNWYLLHCNASIPQLKTPLYPVIHKCLAKELKKRYQTFKELRSELEPLLKWETGEVIVLPEQKELEAWEWNNKGISFYHINAFSQAIEWLDKALRINPQLKEAWNNKGNVYLKNQRYQDALNCYLKAIDIDPNYDLAWNNSGVCIEKMGYQEKAIGCYNKALDINPTYEPAWSNKGDALFRMANYDEAILCFDNALKINPTAVNAWYGKGNCLKEIKKYAEALKCYDATVKIDPVHDYAWYNMGCIFYEINDFSKAISCSNRLITIRPDMAIAWYTKALAEDKTELFSKAIYSYKQFIELASLEYKEQVEYARQRLRELEER